MPPNPPIRTPPGSWPRAEGRPGLRAGVTAQGPLSAGVVTLLSDYEVCREGDVLTAEQARVLVRPPPPAPTTHPAAASDRTRPC